MENDFSRQGNLWLVREILKELESQEKVRELEN